LTGSEGVAVVIGFQSREANRCISSNDDLGQVLYNGSFSLEYHELTSPPYKNFTVEVPNTAPDRTALIRVVRVTLVGAGYYLYMEALNTTGNIA
ncbi:hypothetical protein M404DRAFT_143588, partial [Pisolithus tinctorius Marx 270]